MRQECKTNNNTKKNYFTHKSGKLTSKTLQGIISQIGDLFTTLAVLPTLRGKPSVAKPPTSRTDNIARDTRDLRATCIRLVDASGELPYIVPYGENFGSSVDVFRLMAMFFSSCGYEFIVNPRALRARACLLFAGQTACARAASSNSTAHITTDFLGIAPTTPTLGSSN